jgi:hypothetical protein
MMPELPGTCCETRGFGRPNLDAPPLSPYTSAVPEMDVILNPGGRAHRSGGFSGWQRIFRDVATL